MTKSREEFLRGHERILKQEAKRLKETPWWRFREIKEIRDNIRITQYHIKKIKENK